jgi:transposase
MPRTSPFSIELTPQERDFLEAAARKYTLPYRDVVRAKIILLSAEGLPIEEIAIRLDTRREVVWKWRKRFLAERLAGLQERSRRGRPAVFPP